MAGENELDPNKLLQEFAVSSRNALSTVSAITATLESFKETMEDIKADYKSLHDTVKGNGGGITTGIEYKVLELQRIESECPGKNVIEIKEALLKEFESLRTEFTALKGILLLRKGETTGAQEEKNKRRKESKMIRDIIGDFISSKPIQSALILLVSGALLSLGTCLGVMPKKAHDHSRPAMIETGAVATETAEAR